MQSGVFSVMVLKENKEGSLNESGFEKNSN